MKDFRDPNSTGEENEQWGLSKPFSEKQWTEYYRARDTILAKRRELTETLKSHPEDKEILEREIKFISRDFPKRPHWYLDPETEEEYESLHHCNLINLEELPVHQHAVRWSDAVGSLLAPLVNAAQHGNPEAYAELDTVFWATLNAQTRLEAGREQGFADAYLCANILCCREALREADDAVAGLQELKERGVVSADVLDPLIADGKVVAVMIEAYIQDLCKRVWWD